MISDRVLVEVGINWWSHSVIALPDGTALDSWGLKHNWLEPSDKKEKFVGNWNINIQGVGCHHNGKADIDADLAAEEFVKKLQDQGHKIESATFTSGGKTDLLKEATKAVLFLLAFSFTVPAFGGERPPQAPPINPRFSTLLTPSEPLANVTAATETTYTFTGSQAPGIGVPVLADSPCLNGQCSIAQHRKTKEKTVTTTTGEACTSGSCGSYSSYETVRYSERPAKRGLFGRTKGRCKGCR